MEILSKLIFMNQKHQSLYLILVIGSFLFVLFFIFIFWQKTNFLQDDLVFSEENSSFILQKNIIDIRPKFLIGQKPEKRTVKGLYLTAYSAGSPKTMDNIISLIDSTELNAVVIDVKDYSGKVLYDSDIDLVNEFGLESNRLGDVKEMIKKLHEHDIYVIARQTVFQDPILAEKKTELALKSKNGGLWRDNKGLAWVDANNKDVWNYDLDIAKEVIAFGFDEVNFDYVRFPTDGPMSLLVYTNGDKEKYDVMHEFFQFLNENLGESSAYLSLDFFGFVMERDDGMSIGQRLEDAVDEVDYICPMMYPSHYPAGHLGLANPAEYPGIVIENGMKKGLPYFEETKAQVRPWIQDFNIGAIYDATKIRAQIDMVEKYTDAGWLLWNAANRYSSAGLKIN
ncbi:MAG: sugar fermentation stimulation protein [Candidatus Magasanikbacteria bacterium CG_4_10_14_0_2_um_filter_33_14]|uniref:Sugar fermentation stimulation protein n=1 Tax=Candidatus Magasanikbacteria bacterium CG_4_10_14_0_2_um_filter_33_14 TaxID=1974636 RepID=A0A2M7V9S8_9BACT|nr:MAG: sugar fermentation stimulation protein [Candidatus Magasanikbacteria bacterium CG_4_10_14_0_2_um_filter_33_14]